MKKVFVLFCLSVILAGSAFAGNVKISGNATGSEGKILHIYEYADLLTNTQRQIATVRIDSSGNFTAEPMLSSSGAVILSIDFHTEEVFLETGNTYIITISPILSNSNAEINPFIESQPLEVKFENENPESLNKKISDFNIVYNDFVLKNFNDLYKNRNVKLLNDFHAQMQKDFPDTSNPYFAGYVKYKFAALEHVSNAKGPSQILSTYFMKPPILYRNVEYMDFFNIFFQKYMLAISRSLKFIDFPAIIGKPEAYINMMKTMLADTSLKRADLRELVLLSGLREMYYEPAYNKEMVLKLLKEIAEKTKFAEHRIIADDIIRELTRLHKGTPAPGFSLPDRNKKVVSLADFKGKPVMLSFWTTYCQPCVSYLEKIKPLADQYGAQMTFISISADKSFNKMNMYLKMKKDFTWIFLHIGESIDLLKDYNVKSYPLFVLIDKDGMIYEYPAAPPGEGLEAEVAGMLNP